VINPVRVMVTIDTEEDDWGSYRPGGASVDNILMLPELQRLWTAFGVKPTYLVNYPPMASPEAASVLRALAEDGQCETAAHCHPWNTPPFETAVHQPASMMNQLRDDVNRDKLAVLTRLFEETFRFRPRSFRAGRWGFGPSVARPLHQLGYYTDLSVSPFLDWRRIGGPDYSRAPQLPYCFDPDHPLTPEGGGALVEIPTSVGFLRGPQRASARVRSFLERSPLARFKVVGLVDSMGALARRWLSPETSSHGEMISLAKTLTLRGRRVLDLTFHSSSLLPGATPFVRSEADKRAFVARIEKFLEFCAREKFVFSTANEVSETIRRGTPLLDDDGGFRA